MAKSTPEQRKLNYAAKKRYIAKIKADPVKLAAFKKAKAACAARRYARIKNDPAFKAADRSAYQKKKSDPKFKAARRKATLRRRNDPQLRPALLKKDRERAALAYNHKKNDPAFLEACRAKQRRRIERILSNPEQAAALREKWRERARSPEGQKAQRRKARRLKRKETCARKERMVQALPHGLYWETKEIVTQDMFAAIAARTLRPRDIEKRAPEFLKAHRKAFNPFETLSLDAPVPGLDGVTYLDRLAAQ